MTDLPYEMEPKRGDPMPDGLTWAQRLCYQSVALLTARYRSGEVSADMAKREMLDIKNRYLDAVSRERYIQHCADLFRDIEYAAIMYNKERTLDAADEMRNVIYGLVRYTEEERAEHEQYRLVRGAG